jgi:hypothetical protein
MAVKKKITKKPAAISSASTTPSAPIDAASGLVIGSPEYQRWYDQREMKLSKKDTPVAPNATAVPSKEPVRDLDQEAKDQGIADASEMARVALGNPEEQTSDTPTDKPKVYTASDGTEFTDQNAYVNYVSMLNSNAKEDYNAAQAAAAKKAEDALLKRDAFALIQDTMREYGFTDIETAQLTAFAETQIMDVNIGPNQGILNMKNLPVYKARFAGNVSRLTAGKNALSEADYLQQEDAYGEYMKARGVEALATRSQFATLIGNEISALELDKRLGLAIDRVKNSDPEILKQLKTYYPTITDSDLVTYFLKPKELLPELEKKVATSEISAAAVGQGFAADMTGAAALQAFGVTRKTALTGYEDIKTVLPASEKLGTVYKEAGIKYDRAAGEAEFLKNNVDAAEKRRRLKSLERGSFSADAGMAKNALSSSTSI